MKTNPPAEFGGLILKGRAWRVAWRLALCLTCATAAAQPAGGASAKLPFSGQVMIDPIPITQQPQSVTNPVGGTASFTVLAGGTPPLGYQWRFNGSNLINGPHISGAQSNSLFILNATTNDAGDYTVVITNSAGSITSEAATLTIRRTGTLVLFRTTLGDFEVELYESDKPVTVLNFIRYTQNGRYTNMIMHRVATNWVAQGGGVMVTNRGTTSQTLAPIPTYPPITNEFKVGRLISNGYGTIAMAKTSDPNSATSQFYFNLADNSAALDNPNNSGGFTVFGRVVFGTNILNRFNPGPGNTFINEVNAGGMLAELPVLKSATAALQYEDLIYVEVSLLGAPNFLMQPPSATNVVGTSVSFTAITTGSAPIAYQWYKNGALIPGGTNAAYAISNLVTSDSGGYSVAASNNFGMATSAVGTLTVTDPTTTPVITQQPASVVARPGQPVQFQVQVTNTSPLNYRWTRNGSLLPGGSNATYTIASASVAQAGTYRVTITNVLGSVTSALASLIVDGVKPTVTIAAPLANARVSNATITVTGKVTDAGGPLAGVYYQVNADSWQTASGLTNWLAPVTNLVAGTNLIRVYAMDAVANYSTTNTLKVNYVVTNLLRVLNGGTGLGKVAPYTNNLLEAGKSYTLTATPQAGSLFSNWTCGGVVLTNKPGLQLTLRSNTALEANFVTNAFLSRKGDYVGLFSPSNDVLMADWTNSGAVKLTVTDKGTFTGQLTYQGKVYPLAAGAFDTGGCYTNSIARGKDPALMVGLRLELSAGGGVTGMVKQGTDWAAALWADMGLKKAVKTNYSMTVEQAPDGTRVGTLNLAVQPSGVVTLTGTLSDKTQLTGSLALTIKNEVVLYQTLYGGKGMWLGYVSLVDTNKGWVAHWQKVANPPGFSVNTRLLLP
ncbi:MAG: immunoglobulin domain-containing protein [Verrucomicrobiota bacterium]